MKPLVGKVIKVRFQEGGTAKNGKAFDAFYGVRIALGDSAGSEIVDLTKPAAKLVDGIAVGQLVCVEEFIPTKGDNAGVVTKFFSLLDWGA